jgi:hypothetical protein
LNFDYVYHSPIARKHSWWYLLEVH